MNVRELMAPVLMTTTGDHPVERVRQWMADQEVSSMPVISADGEALGIVTSKDVVGSHPDGTCVGDVMSRELVSVSSGEDLATAARAMRSHRIHHLLVTEGGRMVGMLSSFDLLRVVQDHHFVIKNSPDKKRRGGPHRRRSESRLDKAR